MKKVSGFVAIIFLLFWSIISLQLEATSLPNLTREQTRDMVHDIMKSHATYKELNVELIKRILAQFLSELDPSKTYFIASDIDPWLNPTEQLLVTTLEDFERANYDLFFSIHELMVKAIAKRRQFEEQIDYKDLPKKVDAEEFKEMKWTDNDQELFERLRRIKALQLETAAKLNGETTEKAMQRIAKRQAHFEGELTNPEPVEREKRIYTNILKATAAALDAHTSYFTPGEAEQFMISVQQRLFGIGAQLRDDINGFTILKIIEGGPAWRAKNLKVKDRIIAVDGEPVVGLDIIDAVELIRGREDTEVKLTVIRESGEGDDKKEETLTFAITRGEVVLKEMRYNSSVEPFGDGVIGYLKLFAFYQDPESSSEKDLAEAIAQMKKEHNLKGVILDLRYNSGGLLSQAVGVTGLFISKGVVVSIKDEEGKVQHLRHLDSDHSWDGPLIVLVNRLSASASEIVAGTLQDYGRALIVGDDHTYGKGSFQTFTLNSSGNEQINPQGEYKVTRGRYYTTSGRTPQLIGIDSDIVVPGVLSEMEIGEKFAKYPLESDSIDASFDDDLNDVPPGQRDNIRLLYKYNMQERSNFYFPFLRTLRHNSSERIANSKPYQEFIKEMAKKDEGERDIEPNEEGELDGSPIKLDLQLSETYNIMRDLLYFMNVPAALFIEPRETEVVIPAAA